MRTTRLLWMCRGRALTAAFIHSAVVALAHRGFWLVQVAGSRLSRITRVWFEIDATDARGVACRTRRQRRDERVTLTVTRSPRLRAPAHATRVDGRHSLETFI